MVKENQYYFVVENYGLTQEESMFKVSLALDGIDFKDGQMVVSNTLTPKGKMLLIDFLDERKPTGKNTQDLNYIILECKELSDDDIEDLGRRLLGTNNRNYSYLALIRNDGKEFQEKLKELTTIK